MTVDLPVEATIPTDYCGDEAVRMSLYQRFAAIRTTAQLDDLVLELRDRFGPLPESVQRLVDLAHLRLWANRLGLASIVERDGEVFIRPVVGTRLDPERLRRMIGPGVYVTPNQVRLVTSRLACTLWDALQRVLQEIDTRRATVLLGAPAAPASASAR